MVHIVQVVATRSPWDKQPLRPTPRRFEVLFEIVDGKVRVRDEYSLKSFHEQYSLVEEEE